MTSARRKRQSRDIGWYEALARDADDRLLSSAENFELCLREDSQLEGVLWWETREGAVWFIGLDPFEPEWQAADWQRFNAGRLGTLRSYLLQQWGFKTFGDALWTAIVKVAKEQRFRLNERGDVVALRQEDRF